MCTASHNPKAYTGAKMVERGSRRAVRRPRAERDPRAHRERARRRPRRRQLRGGRHLRRLPARGAEGHRPGAIKPLKVVARRRQRHGGPDGRPDPGPAAGRAHPDLLGARTASSPTTSRTRCCPRTASSSSARCSRPAPTSGSPGTATPTAASSSTATGEFVPGDFLTALLAASRAREGPGRRHPLRRPRLARRARTPSTRLGGRALVNRVGHAFFKTRMRDEGGEFGGEVSGHYYFKAFYNADSGTIPALLILELLSKRETTLAELLRRVPLEVLHLRRDQLDRRRPAGQDGRDQGRATPTPRSPSSTASRSTTRTGTSTCARRTPSRCCA